MFRTLHWAEAVKEAARLDEDGTARAHLSCRGKFRRVITGLYYIREVLGHKQFEGYPETFNIYRQLMDKHLTQYDEYEMDRHAQMAADSGVDPYSLTHTAIIAIEDQLADIRNFVR